MSLRFQINIRVLIISLFILVMGGSIAIWQARNAVSKEADSSLNLALQLIQAGLGSSINNDNHWIDSLSSLNQTRHLKIKLKKTNGQIINITSQAQHFEPNDIPPNWFIRLVVRDYPEAEYKIPTFNNHFKTLIIQANPLDEITEVWHEFIAFFSAILLLILLSFISIHLLFDKTLQAIKIIVKQLKGIETGEYQQKLPQFSIHEYDSIAKAVNHMTDVLETTQKQNKALTQHSLEIQEEERQRLSQELHDELGQSLTAIKVMAVTAAHESTDTKQITSSIEGICDHLMTVVRSMMKQLHPLILSELGLKATLEDLVEQWREREPSLSYSLYCDESIDCLEQTITIQIYRVIQECLTNIIRHAKASQVNISLTIDTEYNNLQLLITDNGQGCNLDQISSGFGLLGIRERINSLAGIVELKSYPDQGMKIKASIPIQ